MADEELGFKVSVVPRDQIPAGTEIASAPTTPEQAVSFSLIPLPQEEAPAPAPPKTTRRRTTRAPVEEPVIPLSPPIVEKTRTVERVEEKVKIVEVPEFQLVPADVGVGEYLGVIWAESEKQAVEIILAKFQGKIEDYTYDLYSKGPRPYFVIRKLPAVQILQEELAPQLQQSPLTIPEANVPETWLAKCPVDLSEHAVPVAIDRFVCPIDGSIIRRPY